MHQFHQFLHQCTDRIGKCHRQAEGAHRDTKSKGNHRNNLAVVDAWRGGLLVSRRPGNSAATHMVSSFIPNVGWFV